MPKYAIYTRKSNDDKKLTEKSTGEQLNECRQIALREGLTVTWECEESRSARTPGRRLKYTELVRLIERGRIDGVLCWHVNRLVRNMEEGGRLVQFLVDGRIKEIRTPHATYKSGENILAVVIEAASATQFSIDLKNTVKRSMDGNFRAGGCNYKAPQGYRNVRDPINFERGRIEVDPERFRLIRKAWEELLTGTATLRQITRHLSEWGYSIRATLNRPERPVSYLAVTEMFRNPFYAGFVKQNGELVRGRHEPMVSVAEFQLAQQILGPNKTARRVHEHAFAGLLKCAYCGQTVTAEIKKLRTGVWEGYHCSNTYGKCTKRGLSSTELEQQIGGQLSSLRIDSDILEVAVETIRSAVREQRTNLAVQTSQQEQALARVEERLRKLTDMWLSGLLTDEERYRGLESQLSAERLEIQMAMNGKVVNEGMMTQNLDASVRLIRLAGNWLGNSDAALKKQVAHECGRLLFFGVEKRVELEVRPLLKDIVSFIEDQRGSFEPPEMGSQSNKKAALQRQVCFGGPKHSGVEVPQSLLDLLASDRIELPSFETSIGIP
ncbi:MAG: recombinase family protein [Armatimonadetes bacterium]|nr:recombinase family protein [Armatimonadota bacterium]